MIWRKMKMVMTQYNNFFCHYKQYKGKVKPVFCAKRGGGELAVLCAMKRENSAESENCKKIQRRYNYSVTMGRCTIGALLPKYF